MSRMGARLPHSTDSPSSNLFDVPLASLHPLSGLTNLMELAVGYSNRYRDSATADLNLAWLPQLERLSLHGLPLHSRYSPRHLSALRYVHLSELPATDIDSLAHLASLEDLSMRDLDIDSLQPILSPRALTSVDLWSLPIPFDLSTCRPLQPDLRRAALSAEDQRPHAAVESHAGDQHRALGSRRGQRPFASEIAAQPHVAPTRLDGTCRRIRCRGRSTRLSVADLRPPRRQARARGAFIRRRRERSESLATE